MTGLAARAAVAVCVVTGLAGAASAQAILAVDRDQVNIRADATVQSRRIAVLARGVEVEQMERHNEWVRVRLPDGRDGWVHSQLVQPRLIVEGQGVRVRSAASSQSASLTMLYRGQEVGQLGQRGNWTEVRLTDGRTGWAYGRYLRAKTAADARALVPTAPAAGQEAAGADLSAPEAAEMVPAETEPAAPPGPAAPVEAVVAVRRNPYVAGLQYEAAGEADSALASFEEVLSGDSANVNALFHAAKAHRQLGQLDASLDKLYRALEISGGRRDVYLTLGEVYRLRGEADSAARYQALFRGEAPPAPAGPPEAEAAVADDGRRLPVGQLAAALVLLAFLVGLGAWLVRRKPSTGEQPQARPERGRSGRRFERALEQEEAAARQGHVTPEEDKELDRQIEDKWRELRESADLFAAPASPPAGEGEEANLNRLLDQVESLRRGLDLQDERARLYADIVRLQNMKIEAMREELRLRGRRR